MKAITFWASRHVMLSWAIIAIGLILLYFFGVMWGFILSDYLPGLDRMWMIFGVLSLIMVIIAVYPSKSERRKFMKEEGGIFRKWKVYDMTLVLMMMVMGVHFGYDTQVEKLSNNRTIASVAEMVSFIPVVNVANTSRDNVRKNRVLRWIDGLQSRFNKRIRAFVTANFTESNMAGKIIFVLLGGFISLILSGGLGFLACTLSCNGYGLLAVVTLVLGVLLIIGMIFLSARWMNRSYDKRKGIEKSKKESNKESIYLTLLTLAVTVISFAVYISVL